MSSARQLAVESLFNFKSWAMSWLPGFIPNIHWIGNGGIDGLASLTHKPNQLIYSAPISYSKLALAQVKIGKFSLSALRDSIHVLDREKAVVVVGVRMSLDLATSKEAES